MKQAKAKAIKSWNPFKEMLTLGVEHDENIKTLLLKKDQQFALVLVQKIKDMMLEYNELCFSYQVESCLNLEIEIDLQIEILNQFFKDARKFKEAI